MPLTKQEWLSLEEKAHQLRRATLDTTHFAGSGHIGGGLSAMDIMVVLYYKYMNLKKDDPTWEDRDRFILSKGHAGIAYAPLLVDQGWNDAEQLKTFNHTNSKMGIHLDANKVVGVDASTGSLGHGLSIAVGTALAARVLGKSYYTYCVTGDGELGEGSNWEAAMSAAHYNTTNLVCFVDRNRCMIDGRTEDIMRLEPLADKFTAFGMKTLEIDGHNFKELCEAIDFAHSYKEAPVMIVANTIKACGIDYMEDDYVWHYGSLDDDAYNRATESLNRYYEARKARVNKEG